MKNLPTLIFVLAISTTSISSSMAAEEGIYSLIGVGVTPITDTTTTTISFGLNLGGGYNFSKYVGTEAQLALLGMATTNNLTAHPFAVTINGYLPIKENLTLFGKAGKSYTTVSNGTAATSVSQSGITNVYGYGLEFVYGDNKKYRFGVDHYDLSVAPGMTLSTNYISVAAIVNY